MGMIFAVVLSWYSNMVLLVLYSTILYSTILYSTNIVQYGPPHSIYHPFDACSALLLYAVVVTTEELVGFLIFNLKSFEVK